MKSATQTLNDALQKIGQTIYQKQQQQPPPRHGGQEPPTPPSGEGVKGEGTVEGEFREI
jgi:molecular chaperone DnaK